jgi:hypothetical protein
VSRSHDQATVPVHLPFEAPWDSDPVVLGQRLVDLLCSFEPSVASPGPPTAGRDGAARDGAATAEPDAPTETGDGSASDGGTAIRRWDDGSSVEVDGQRIGLLDADGRGGIYRAGDVVFVSWVAEGQAPERLRAVGRLYLDAYERPTRDDTDDGSVVGPLDRLEHPRFDPADPELGSFVLDLRPADPR